MAATDHLLLDAMAGGDQEVPGSVVEEREGRRGLTLFLHKFVLFYRI